MAPIILPAGPADAADLARVHVTAWRETYRGLLSDAFLARMSQASHARRFRALLTRPNPGEVILTAVTPEGLVAYAGGGPSRRRAPGWAEVDTLYVVKAAQGAGLGRGLMAAMARALAAAGGARSLSVSVLRDNHGARAFYEALGGRPEAPRRERGPGGVLLYEVRYVWPEIAVLESAA